MQDRPYQIDHANKLVDEVISKRKVIGQMPTGGGKTVEFAKICLRFITNTDGAVLIVVDREELLHQAERQIRKICKVKPYIIDSSTKKFHVSRVYIAMVDSLTSRMNLMYDVRLVVIDECHVANFNKLHSQFLTQYIIGFTATPKSSSKNEPLNKYYNSIVVGPQIKELISMGFLAQNITRCPKDVVDAAKFEVDRLKGDYNEAKMAAEYRKPKHITNVVQAYNRFCNGKKTIIFNVTVQHSLDVTECFVFCGYKCRHLDAASGKRPSSDIRFKTEREEILHWFKTTEDAILCNVGIATRGFDEPTIQNVILNFSTLSLPKFLQCCGRGSRIIDEYFIREFQNDYPYKLELKTYFNIIDMGGNSIDGKHFDWNEDRDWERIFEQPDEPSEGVAPVKTCPQCDGLVHAAATICPLLTDKGELCLYEFEKKKTAKEQDLEEMILITKGINVDELISKHQKKYEYYTFLNMGHDVVKEMYEYYDHIPSETIQNRYFDAYYELCKEWYNKTLAGKDGNLKDISDSARHIRMARNNFNNIIKDFKDKYTKQCEGCEIYFDKYSFTLDPNKDFCDKCTEVNQAHERSVRGY